MEEGLDHPNYEKITFQPPGFQLHGYEFVEVVQPEPQTKKRMQELASLYTHVHTAQPVSTSLWGERGFIFFVE